MFDLILSKYSISNTKYIIQHLNLFVSFIQHLNSINTRNIKGRLLGRKMSNLSKSIKSVKYHIKPGILDDLKAFIEDFKAHLHIEWKIHIEIQSNSPQFRKYVSFLNIPRSRIFLHHPNHFEAHFHQFNIQLDLLMIQLGLHLNLLLNELII
eukprot:NODE_112_length_18534_cov_1.163656.p13 type:complete len:152 gc:universal NODE_112_length_18534_cov_1.163656:7458-7003(-)